MTYDEAVELIRDHTDYGGHVDAHALAVAIATGKEMPRRDRRVDERTRLYSAGSSRGARKPGSVIVRTETHLFLLAF